MIVCYVYNPIYCDPRQPVDFGCAYARKTNLVMSTHTPKDCHSSVSHHFLPSLTVSCCANHTNEHLHLCYFLPGCFLYLFPPPIYLTGQPVCWDITLIYIACQVKIYYCFPARRFCVFMLFSLRLCRCSCMMAAPGGNNLSSSVNQAASFNFIKPWNISLQAQSWYSKFWGDF